MVMVKAHGNWLLCRIKFKMKANGLCSRSMFLIVGVGEGHCQHTCLMIMVNSHGQCSLPTYMFHGPGECSWSMVMESIHIHD